jgi:chromosome segregation ATPase
MRSCLSAAAFLISILTFVPGAVANDASAELARARDALAAAHATATRAKQDLAARSGEATDLRSDLDEAKRDIVLIEPLLRDAERAARTSLDAARTAENRLQSAAEDTARGLDSAEQSLRAAAVHLTKQVAQEKAIIVTRDEYKSALQAQDETQQAIARAQGTADASANADPAIAPLRAEAEALEARVKQLRADSSPELPKVSKQWIEAKGRYETARRAFVSADQGLQQATRKNGEAQAAFRAVNEKLTAAIDLAEDVVAARQSIARARQLRDEAARKHEAASTELESARAESRRHEEAVRQWHDMPKRLSDRISASQEKLASLASAIDKLKRDVEDAEAEIERAKSAVSDAERRFAVTPSCR